METSLNTSEKSLDLSKTPENKKKTPDKTPKRSPNTENKKSWRDKTPSKKHGQNKTPSKPDKNQVFGIILNKKWTPKGYVLNAVLVKTTTPKGETLSGLWRFSEEGKGFETIAYNTIKPIIKKKLAASAEIRKIHLDWEQGNYYFVAIVENAHTRFFATPKKKGSELVTASVDYDVMVKQNPECSISKSLTDIYQYMERYFTTSAQIYSMMQKSALTTGGSDKPGGSSNYLN